MQKNPVRPEAWRGKLPPVLQPLTWKLSRIHECLMPQYRRRSDKRLLASLGKRVGDDEARNPVQQVFIEAPAMMRSRQHAQHLFGDPTCVVVAKSTEHSALHSKHPVRSVAPDASCHDGSHLSWNTRQWYPPVIHGARAMVIFTEVTRALLEPDKADQK